MFNQQLLARHCMTESDARKTWKSLVKVCQEEEDNVEKFEDSIVEINAGLKTIGLEIRGVSIASTSIQQQSSQQSSQSQSSTQQQQDGNTPGSSKSKSSAKRQQHVRYYAIVNKFPDEVAKHCFSSHGTPNEACFIRHILEQFASLASSDNNDDDNTTPPAMARSKIINSRNDMVDNDNKNIKITLPQAETIVDKLLDEKWLMYEQQQDGGTSGGQRQRQRHRGSNTSKIVLAPRTYLELSYFLESSGMEQDDLPQLIYHTD